MKTDKPIIVTTDKHTADLLKELGYPLLSETSTQWTFVNDAVERMSFADEKDMKLVNTKRVTL